VKLTPLTRVVSARFISRTGGEAAFFVGIWGKLAYELDGDASDIALVLGVAGVTALIGSAVAGTLVDRFGPKRVLIGAEILFVPSVLSALLVATVPQFAAVVALIGLTSAPAFTAIASLPPFLTADQHFAALHHHRDGVHELQAGPIATSLGNPRPFPEPEVRWRGRARNYGLVHVDPLASPPTLTIEWYQPGSLMRREVIEAAVGFIATATAG